MKIIQLNTWGGILFDELCTFLRTHATDTDVFCLQEVIDADVELGPVDFKSLERMRTTRKATEEILHDFVVFYSPFFSGFDEYGTALPHQFSLGNALCVRKTHAVRYYAEHFIHGRFNTVGTPDAPDSGTTLQYATIELHGKPLTIVNVHGLARIAPKEVIPERIAQSHKIREVLRHIKGDIIMCGDFNLDPDTESIAIIKKGFTDLIAEHNVQSTRSEHYPAHFKQWADYIFLSPTLRVKRFAVLPDVVSDHLALLLETEDK